MQLANHAYFYIMHLTFCEIFHLFTRAWNIDWFALCYSMYSNLKSWPPVEFNKYTYIKNRDVIIILSNRFCNTSNVEPYIRMSRLTAILYDIQFLQEIIIYVIHMQIQDTWIGHVRPGQVDSQFIVRDISKIHVGRRSFFIFHSTADY